MIFTLHEYLFYSSHLTLHKKFWIEKFIKGKIPLIDMYSTSQYIHIYIYICSKKNFYQSKYGKRSCVFGWYFFSILLIKNCKKVKLWNYKQETKLNTEFFITWVADTTGKYYTNNINLKKKIILYTYLTVNIIILLGNHVCKAGLVWLLKVVTRGHPLP